MSRQWVKGRKSEHYYKKAKRKGYRSRSAYKLKQINDRYNIISPKDKVLDLGAAPGGWSQVAKEIAGQNGAVIGVDIQNIEPIEGIIFIRGDVTKSKTINEILSMVNKLDCVISDMSPNITGNYSLDHARSIDLAQSALIISRRTLKKGGNFVVKVFQGDLYNDFLKEVKARFSFVKAHSPKASRKSSSEIYIIGKGFVGP